MRIQEKNNNNNNNNSWKKKCVACTEAWKAAVWLFIKTFVGPTAAIDSWEAAWRDFTKHVSSFSMEKAALKLQNVLPKGPISA